MFLRMLICTAVFLIVSLFLSACGAICFPLTAKGFASLEAKRRFRAPRSTPKHPHPMNETSRPAEHVTEEAVACKTHCSPASLLDSRYLGIASSPDDYVDNDAVIKYPKSLESPSNELHDKKDILVDKRSPQDPLQQQSRHSMRKPCMTLHKEREWKPVSDEGKTRTENTEVIMRSSFQHKLAKENDEENQNEKLLGKEDVCTDKCENVNPDCEYKSASVAVEVQTRIKNRKTIVRSSYFPHKSVNENDQDNRHEKLLVKDDLTTCTCENAIPESSSSGNSCFNSSIMKRKVASVDSIQMKNMNYKCSRTNASLPIQSNSISNLDDSVLEMKAEGREFGCNISHLENYSDIAEKSMEKFVSVISSFRCSSSGSRASGLRAPLKDVQNTCTSRSNVVADFNKFAYVPTDRKASSAHRRR